MTRRASVSSPSAISSTESPRSRWCAKTSGASGASSASTSAGLSASPSKHADVDRPRGIRAGAIAQRPGLTGQRDVAVALEQLDHRAVERRQPVGRRRARPERRRPAQQRVLEFALVLVEQRLSDRRDVGIAAIQRPLPHAGGGRDLLHRHGAALDEQPLGG